MAKMLTLRHKNLIQNTLSAVSSVGTSGYFSEVSEVKEHNALPGQEQEARSEEHSGWSLAASVFIVSLDTTLKPEDGSKNRTLNALRKAGGCWRISVFKKSDNEFSKCNVALLLLSSQYRAV